ncbi:hypothetical protein HanXRQr2_Chr12g0539311 [Helianthus annuus]|uniref:Uncharacterized protein n=1 Tax=Helianthus annuus TaxID=4232 RepID=A0A9K3MVW1_HELAN|nr:hypothetical protein HanXRQr2_Chr12g0539311 [Helianthus annuus]KAJ0862512.1 hypothetical protein HanPSC8_Chr12g0519111 [Helianthus annuus]
MGTYVLCLLTIKAYVMSLWNVFQSATCLSLFPSWRDLWYVIVTLLINPYVKSKLKSSFFIDKNTLLL